MEETANPLIHIVNYYNPRYEYYAFFDYFEESMSSAM